MTDRPHVRVSLGWRPPDGGDRRSSFVGRCTIGRDPTNDVILASMHVSRRHAVLEVRDGVLYVRNFSRSTHVRVPRRQPGIPLKFWTV